MVQRLASPVADATTLSAAHEMMSRLWPGLGATSAAWLTYRQQGAELYERVAALDSRHHHEALCWAQYQRDMADELSKRLNGMDSICAQHGL